HPARHEGGLQRAVCRLRADEARRDGNHELTRNDSASPPPGGRPAPRSWGLRQLPPRPRDTVTIAPVKRGRLVGSRITRAQPSADRPSGSEVYGRAQGGMKQPALSVTLGLLLSGSVLGSCSRRMPIPPEAGSNAERECQSVCREGQVSCLGTPSSTDVWTALISAGFALFQSGDCGDGLA